MARLNKLILFWVILVAGYAGLLYGLDAATERDRHYRLGRIYYDNGFYDEAQHEFNKALELSGAASETHANQQSSLDKSAETGQKKEGVRVDQPGANYIVGTGDTLVINVWENDDLNKEVRVRPDGKISFPLIDEIDVSGLTIPEVDDIITEKLEKFIKYPEVTVSLVSMGANKVIVLGEVKWPGVYALDNRRTVLEAVAQAGGFTQEAVLNSVIVIKGGLDNPKVERINLSKALLKADMKGDLALASQDIVYVPRKFISDLEYFINHAFDIMTKGVNNADAMRLYKNSR